MEEVNNPPVKKKRGNPNLKPGHKNQHINKDKNSSTMSENTETTATEEKEVKTENTSSTINELPNDIFSDEMPKEEVLPLDDEVKTKAYANIPEGQPATAQSTTTTDSATGETKTTTTPGASTPPPVAPITPEEMQNQAAQTVNLMLKGYEKLHALGRYMGKMDQQELMMLHSKGKIDLNADLPLGNKSIKVNDFFTEYNAGIDENITVSDEFKKEITPPLTRIAIKHKLFLSDEMYVGMIVAEDLATKISILVGLKKSANLVLEAVTQMNASKSKSSSNSTGAEDTSSADAWREPEVQDAQPVN